MQESIGITGKFILRVYDLSGEQWFEEEYENLVTSYGDQYYAERAANIGANAVASGLKMGTGTTASAKTGAGSFLTTYLAGTNIAFDSTPTSTLVAGTRKITYIGTWGAGIGTGTPQEVVIVNDATGNATSPTGATLSRVVLTAPPAKAAPDIWIGTWEHNFLGV